MQQLLAILASYKNKNLPQQKLKAAMLTRQIGKLTQFATEPGFLTVAVKTSRAVIRQKEMTVGIVPASR